MEKERRFVPNGGEVRAKGEGRTIEGKANPFNSWTLIGGMFYERVSPEAFDDVLGDSVVIQFNHDPNYPLGRTPKTAELWTEADGLYYRVADMPKSREDVFEAIQRQDVQGNSFSFSVAQDGEEWNTPRANCPNGPSPE